MLVDSLNTEGLLEGYDMVLKLKWELECVCVCVRV